MRTFFEAHAYQTLKAEVAEEILTPVVANEWDCQAT
jgi:hypothetical protein